MQASPDAHRAFLETRYFAPLDGLRCLSIVAVIGLHALGELDPVFGRGGMGVQLFFVISGFLITTLLLREQERNGRISLRDFYVRRTLRIFPLYYAVLGLYVVLVFAMERHTAEGAAFFHNLPAFLTYTSDWFIPLDRERVIFYFAWSLATEEQFYLFWPCVLYFARSWRTPLVVISALLLGDLAAEAAVGAGWLAQNPVPGRIVTSIATPICMGCILAYACHSPRAFGAAYRVLGRSWSLPAALGLLAVAYGARSTPEILVFVVMTLVLGAACIRPDPGWMRLLANPVARYVGTISYGMYLLHMLALNTARRLPVPDGWPVFLAGLAITVAAAALTYRYFEQPFLRLKDRFGRPRPASGWGEEPRHARVPAVPV